MQLSQKKINVSSHRSWCFIILAMGIVSGCSVNTDGPEVTLEKANIMSDRGRYEDAVPLYTEAASAFPNRGHIYYRRGVCYENLGLLPRALDDYLQCLEVQPSHTDALNNKGVVLAKLERYKEAAEAFTNLVRQQPDNVLALRNRGLCQHDQGNFDEALADYTAAIAVASHEAENWFQRGNVYLEQGQLAEAEADYTQAVELDASHAKAWMNRGVGRYNAGERKLAMQYLEHARELDENIIIPGIDWSELAPAAAEIVAVPIVDDAIFNWEACSAVAQSVLASHGYEQLSVVKNYPSFRCSRLSAQKDGKDVAVFLGCETADSYHVALAAVGPTDKSATRRVLMILRHTPSVDDAVAAYSVSRFVENWKAEPGHTRPVVVFMDLVPQQETPAP
jgi:tetratricopeptide (TPR) repeat protein